MEREWIKTDPDCFQYQRWLGGRSYEAVQATTLPNGVCLVCHTTIDLEDYTEKDIVDCIETYGYDSLEVLEEEYGAERVDAIAAEYLFEQLDFNDYDHLCEVLNEDEAEVIILRIVAEN